MEKIQVAVANGDGAAPEMMAVAKQIAVEAAKFDEIDLEFVDTPMGWNVFDEAGTTLPEESLKKAEDCGVLFFGGVGDPELDKTLGGKYPKMKPEAKCLLTIRKQWGLLLNFRPAIFYKSLQDFALVKPENIPDEGVEQHWIRFLLEDSYFGLADLLDEIPAALADELGLKMKDQVTGKESQVAELSYYKRDTLIKYFTAAFEYAKKYNLPVISVDKANVMPRYLFWRKICEMVHESFPDVELRHQLVDSCNALLYTPAKLGGVIACGNEHGDILSDGAIAGVGSLGMMYSSAINPETKLAMFESGAGTAADIAGQDKANPLGRTLTAAMMLDHIGAEIGAKKIRLAVSEVLETTPFRTRDLVTSGGVSIVGCSEMGDIIMEKMMGDHYVKTYV